MKTNRVRPHVLEAAAAIVYNEDPILKQIPRVDKSVAQQISMTQFLVQSRQKQPDKIIKGIMIPNCHLLENSPKNYLNKSDKKIDILN
jgi:hypothetical protein